MNAPREETERDVAKLCAAGNVENATTTTIRAYGPEILGFLTALHRSEDIADEVFSLWCERIFRGLGAFGWECSLRTWVYTIARNASKNHRRDQHVAQRRAAPLSEEISHLEGQVRTETRPYLRTEAKSKLAELRDALSPEDRMLLVLRLDKGLEWKEVAQVMLGNEEPADDTHLGREAQRLRKRFQLVKDRLVQAARTAGILDRSE
jgi:RNA polymerase sigma-70 factor, ECF subfamily